MFLIIAGSVYVVLGVPVATPIAATGATSPARAPTPLPEAVVLSH